jgi:hypothetical protein
MTRYLPLIEAALRDAGGDPEAVEVRRPKRSNATVSSAFTCGRATTN